ncbi:unnamed protein product [Mytilus edulis]|uniref:Uncharacterized protein n=1 Tax=Mytilus edulis TaxID=6550 RepID=A0A8S3TY01_MYTED|nr:unnamed protein product [Mytilus edulis]
MSDINVLKRGRKPTLTDSAKKRRRTAVNAKCNKNRIYLGSQYDRWSELKCALRLQSHAEVAKILLDRYEFHTQTDQGNPNTIDANTISEKPTNPVTNINDVNTAVEKPTSPAPTCSAMSEETSSANTLLTTSTPGPLQSKLQQHSVHLSDVSEISSSEREHESRYVEETQMSGIEEISRKTDSLWKSAQSSFVNPFDLTITISEGNYEDDDDNFSDEDYEPSFDATYRQDHGVESESENEGFEDESADPSDQQEEDLGPSIKKIRSETEVDTFLDDRPLIVYMSSILSLAKTHIPPICAVKGCRLPLTIKMELISSALYLKWVCQNKHLAHKWCSQPILNRRLHSGDLVFSAGILLSGNNYQKIADLAKFIRLPILCNSTFLKIQRTYLVPSIDSFWVQSQDMVLQEFRDKEIVILGDGRMDSPGHCAQFCSYTFMEYNTKKILTIVTMDKRMTEKKSTNLEKACFLKGLRQLLDKNMKVVEVVTDAHIQVESLMKKEFSNIKHSFDIWHGAKNLGKKVVKVAQEQKANKPLLEWSRDIVNHFWHCADISTTEQEFIGSWFGIMHHTVNKHQWMIAYSDTAGNECKHGPLSSEREKGWLTGATPPHDALIKIVMDKRFLRKIPYYLNCRSTAELENFQNVILKYASKRHSYGPSTYNARNQLAAIDHNAHCERKVVTNKDGTKRLQRYYSKKGGRWTATEVKTPKQYIYIPELMKHIIMKRLSDDIGMSRRVILDPFDPRRLSATIAPVPPPPTQDLMAAKISRFNREDLDRTIDYDFDQTIDYEWPTN